MGSGVTGVTQILVFVDFFWVDSVSAPRASFAPSHFDNSIAVDSRSEQSPVVVVVSHV